MKSFKDLFYKYHGPIVLGVVFLIMLFTGVMIFLKGFLPADLWKETINGIIVLGGVIIFVLLLIGIGALFQYIVNNFNAFIDWLKYNDLSCSIRDWIKNKIN